MTHPFDELLVDGLGGDGGLIERGVRLVLEVGDVTEAAPLPRDAGGEQRDRSKRATNSH